MEFHEGSIVHRVNIMMEHDILGQKYGRTWNAITELGMQHQMSPTIFAQRNETYL